MHTWLTFVRSEEDDTLGLLSSTLSLHNHSLWGLFSHLLLLGRIPISKWGLRPSTKVQAFAPTKTIDNSYSNSELYLNFKIYLLNLGVYLYHKKNSHISNLKLIIKNEIKNMMSSIILSLSKKKLIYRFYMLLFVNIYFFKSQKYKWSPKQLFFVFGILKIVLKSWSQRCKIGKLLSEN